MMRARHGALLTGLVLGGLPGCPHDGHPGWVVRARAGDTTADMPPALQEAILADARRRISAAAPRLHITAIEKVTWPDGGLGCVHPGEIATQAKRPGYRVLVSAEPVMIEYHAASDGEFRICGIRSPGPPPVEDPYPPPGPSKD